MSQIFYRHLDAGGGGGGGGLGKLMIPPYKHFFLQNTLKLGNLTVLTSLFGSVNGFSQTNPCQKLKKTVEGYFVIH